MMTHAISREAAVALFDAVETLECGKELLRGLNMFWHLGRDRAKQGVGKGDGA